MIFSLIKFQIIFFKCRTKSIQIYRNQVIQLEPVARTQFVTAPNSVGLATSRQQATIVKEYLPSAENVYFIH